MSINLPSRYEDLSDAYKGRLKPNQVLISILDKAWKSMKISGGIRFLPIYGESGSGKSSASRELSTHMPDVEVHLLRRNELESNEALIQTITDLHQRLPGKLLVFVVDQYEENVQGRERIPTQFVEYLSLLDRGDLRNIPSVFIWLTTSSEFRDSLVYATTRNKRILLDVNFEIEGPAKSEWPTIIEETFSFHNSDTPLSDYGIIREDLVQIGYEATTIGECIELVGNSLAENIEGLQNISEYQVILLWPVSDGLRNQRVMQFSRPREGYRLNWDAWYSELNDDDRRTLPLHDFNRTRLYFDFRILPIRAADLQKLCFDLDDEEKELGSTYLKRFAATHFYHLVSDNWENYDYNPVRERESQRSKDAQQWYETVTTQPTKVGRRVSRILRQCGLSSKYEENISTKYSTVRADVYVETSHPSKPKKIIELKVYSSENTMPSTIKEQIKITLRRHAQLAGFIGRQ
jgi:ABC-type dipeptide/oligopeptide/nickel transport system ATPase component